MACFVTGIIETNDIAQVEKILAGVPNLDHSKLSVITASAKTDAHEDSFVPFLHAAGGASIMTGDGGTNVPGINRDPQALGYLGHNDVVNAIGILPIPEDEAANYNDALEAGRCIVAYDCSNGDEAAVESAFQAAGVRRVKVFGKR